MIRGISSPRRAAADAGVAGQVLVPQRHRHLRDAWRKGVPGGLRASTGRECSRSRGAHSGRANLPVLACAPARAYRQLGDCVEDRSGTAVPRRGHLHLTELRGTCAVNPLAPGHLKPYEDAVRPEVVALGAVDRGGALLDPARLAGPFGLVAQAQALPPFPVPPPWQDLPLTPAAVRWRLTANDGRAVSRGRSPPTLPSRSPQTATTGVCTRMEVIRTSSAGARLSCPACTSSGSRDPAPIWRRGATRRPLRSPTPPATAARGGSPSRSSRPASRVPDAVAPRGAPPRGRNFAVRAGSGGPPPRCRQAGGRCGRDSRAHRHGAAASRSR